AKPACMKYTRNAATSVQITFAELYITISPLLFPKPIREKQKRRADSSARRLCLGFDELILAR
ncbi:MAG: hypothetical protein ACI4KN_03595, partial [Gemmiger sp.]